MSHFAFYAEPTPVATRHSEIYVGVGESTGGHESIGIVTAGSDRFDIHLSREQAIQLIDQLTECTTVLERQGVASEPAQS
ncbi:hypothetical protein SEA_PHORBESPHLOWER_44 [Gordonia phage PhorbesPhlower]|nr:hypothetical protein SEA_PHORBESPHLOWER_44 [Gordonia phage PhorbesPhlower]